MDALRQRLPSCAYAAACRSLSHRHASPAEICSLCRVYRALLTLASSAFAPLGALVVPRLMWLTGGFVCVGVRMLIVFKALGEQILTPG
jgi:hypothetical protein